MSTSIQSNKVIVNASIEEVFTYVNDFNNVIHLLPQDKISDWNSDENQCSFKIQSAATIPLVKDSTNPNTTIHIVSGEKAPFPFTLDVYFKDVDGNCEAYLDFNGEINAFLKMMVVGPLTNLFNYMAKKLQEIHE